MDLQASLRLIVGECADCAGSRFEVDEVVAMSSGGPYGTTVSVSRFLVCTNSDHACEIRVGLPAQSLG